jgi:magnesium chelatase family protein
MQLSARGFFRVLRVARTIADLRGSATVGASDVGEALRFRGEAPSS